MGSAYTEEDANNDFGGYNSTGYSTDMVHGDWTGESDPEAESDSDDSEVNNEGGEDHPEAHSSDYEQELDEVLTREFEAQALMKKLKHPHLIMHYLLCLLSKKEEYT